MAAVASVNSGLFVTYRFCGFYNSPAIKTFPIMPALLVCDASQEIALDRAQQD